MKSPTQRRLSHGDIIRLVHASLGPYPEVVDCGPLAGGGFAAVWSVRLDDGRRVVVKVGPPPGVRLLRYEHGLIAAEARYFRLLARRLPQLPVPRVRHHGRDASILDGEWLVTGLLPGRSLADLPPGTDGHRVRADFGAALAAVHTITGDRYGYPDGRRTSAPTWRAAFLDMVDDLLADAVDHAVALPIPAERIRDLVIRHAALLDVVDRPALLHFDGWDGNVLATPDETGELRMTGLVDGERHLYGDPLLDFVSPALFGRIEDEPAHPFRRGYAEATGRLTGRPLDFDEPARDRLRLYRSFLYLLMVVEMPSRGITAGADPEQYDFRLALLQRSLTELGEPGPRLAQRI